MGQISILSVDARVLIIPTFIRKVVIDVNEHSKVLETLEKENPGLLFRIRICYLRGVAVS